MMQLYVDSSGNHSIRCVICSRARRDIKAFIWKPHKIRRREVWVVVQGGLGGCFAPSPKFFESLHISELI